ncbi:MAG: metallophosphoesterase [Bacteriovoracaceae bacterium]
MSKKWFIFFFILINITVGVYLHTNTLTITYHNVTLRSGNKKIRIAHVTDLHTKGLGRIEKQLLVALKTEKPDVIVITGDIATPTGTEKGYESVLKELKAPQGIFFVQGNWEYWEPIQNLKMILNKNNIKDMTNQTHFLDQNLWLVGFDDSEEGQPHLEILDNLPKSALKIGLFHSPVFFEKTAGLVNLNLAGHSHGGQFRIPFLGHLWVPQGTGRFDQGWFEKDHSKLFVSRGIGTSILPMRFNCAPELAIINIQY